MNVSGYFVSSELFIELLECIHYLHKHNIIHKNLEPANILITHGLNGRFIKLVHFDLDVIQKITSQSHTRGSATVEYIAPEVKGEKSYDMKSDIYSLGIIIPNLFNIDINL